MDAFFETRQYDSGIKVWHKSYKDLHFIPHWHPEYELIYVMKGQAKITVDEKTVFAEAGDLVLCSSGDIHYSDSDYMNNELVFLIFDPLIIHDSFNTYQLTSPHLSHKKLQQLGLDGLIQNTFQMIGRELMEQRDYHEELIRSQLQKLCFSLIRQTNHLVLDEPSQNKHKDNLFKFQELLYYIEQHYNEDISLDDAAEMTNFSPSYFSTLFKQHTGYTFVKYVNAIRIERAISMLHQNYNMTDIAFECGFNNSRNFNRVFKEFTGVTPTAYLKTSATNQITIKSNIRKSAIQAHTDNFVNKTLVSRN